MNHEHTAPDFPQVVRELSPVLLRYLRRYVGDAALAEDLLQETLLRIEHGLPGFAGQSRLDTWAYSIANHVAADHLRQQQRVPRLVDIELAEDVAADTPDVDERMVVDEMNACVREVIDGLPGDYRAALILHDLDGKTAEETAAILECSLATAKIRIHRARRKLKEALTRECEFYRDRENVLRCER